MRKQTRYIPPAFKYGVYSGIGLLPTEDPAEFRKVKQKIFDELALAGPLEEGIGEHMACLLWRMQNLSTYSLADRARERRGLIYAKLCPSNGTMLPLLQPETRSSEELAALYKSADHQARTELGAPVELVEIGEVATVEYLERELAARGTTERDAYSRFQDARHQIDVVLCRSRSAASREGRITYSYDLAV